MTAFKHFLELVEAHPAKLGIRLASMKAKIEARYNERGLLQVTEEEMKMTAAVIAQLDRLPESTDTTEATAILKTIVSSRGCYIELTADELLVHDSMKTGGPLCGVARLCNPEPVWHVFQP